MLLSHKEMDLYKILQSIFDFKYKTSLYKLVILLKELAYPHVYLHVAQHDSTPPTVF